MSQGQRLGLAKPIMIGETAASNMQNLTANKMEAGPKVGHRWASGKPWAGHRWALGVC